MSVELSVIGETKERTKRYDRCGEKLACLYSDDVAFIIQCLLQLVSFILFMAVVITAGNLLQPANILYSHYEYRLNYCIDTLETVELAGCT
jgi:hypothetical protein